MKNQILLLSSIVLLLVVIASIKNKEPEGDIVKTVEIKTSLGSGAKIEPLKKSKKEEVEIKDEPILVADTKSNKIKKRMTPILRKKEIELEIDKLPIDIIKPRPYTPIVKKEGPLEIKYEIGLKYKQVESLIAQDNYMGFSFKESQKGVNANISIPKKGYYLDLKLDSIDNETMSASYINYGATLGYRINKKLDLGIEYQKNNLIYRSDYLLNFDQVSLIGLSANYKIINKNNYKLSSELKYLKADKDSQRDFMLNLEIPMNKVDIGVGYGLSNRETEIDNSKYKGNYKRKDDILEFGINYSF